MAERYPSVRAIITCLVISFGCSMLGSIEMLFWAISASSMGFGRIFVCMWARVLIQGDPYVPFTIASGFSGSSHSYQQVSDATSPMVESRDCHTRASKYLTQQVQWLSGMTAIIACNTASLCHWLHRSFEECTSAHCFY